MISNLDFGDLICILLYLQVVQKTIYEIISKNCDDFRFEIRGTEPSTGFEIGSDPSKRAPLI